MNFNCNDNFLFISISEVLLFEDRAIYISKVLPDNIKHFKHLLTDL